MRLNARTISALKVNGKDAVYWDARLTGFGVRIKPNGHKTYVIQYRYRGQSKRITIGDLGTWILDEAKEHARKLLQLVDQGKDPQHYKPEATLTVSELCSEYLTKLDAGLILGRKGTPKKASTAYTDRGRIKRHIIPLLGSISIRELTKVDIKHFVEAVTLGKTKLDLRTKKQGRSIVKGGSGTARRTTGLLGGILSYAVEEGYIESNPCSGVRRPKDRKRTRRLSQAEYLELGQKLPFLDPWQARVCIRLIALTGMRRQEALGLKWSQVDLERRILVLTDTKTGDSVRPLPLPAYELLKGLPSRNGVFVFPGIKVPKENYSGLDKAFPRLKVDYTLHTLRHSFASEANDLGYSELTIGAMIGHGKNSTTADYIHHIDSVLLAAADRVSGRVAELMRTVS